MPDDLNIFTDDYYLLDFETGSLPGNPNFRPVEVGLLRHQGGKTKVWTSLVNPKLDDPNFVIDLGAQEIHHITQDMLDKDGISTAKMVEMIQKGIGQDDLPLWAHNGVPFDYPLLDSEYQKQGVPRVKRERLRDSAGIYKGWRINRHPDQYPNLLEYFRAVLNTRVKGLLFNLNHLVTTLTDLGLIVVRDDDGRALGWQVEERLGIDAEQQRKLASVGFHRCGFDVVATHAVVQWERRELAAWLRGDPLLPETES